ncbi:MAG: hypothetical protein WDN47_01205 [Candidatus Doudnabacteria bacterium]
MQIAGCFAFPPPMEERRFKALCIILHQAVADTEREIWLIEQGQNPYASKPEGRRALLTALAGKLAELVKAQGDLQTGKYGKCKKCHLLELRLEDLAVQPLLKRCGACHLLEQKKLAQRLARQLHEGYVSRDLPLFRPRPE